ncbi:hypothetical protein [Luteolibacter sp. Populi]|uniref:hypothetical protein n=1 Tax=Luteolibacter sp. Populi TaxID=3230487 RepID=UPI0034669AAB
MKGRTFTWFAVLVASHVAAFLLARRHADEVAVAPTPGIVGTDDVAARRSPGRGSERTAHARLWQKLLDSDLSRADFELARKRLLADWMKHDLGAVLDLLWGPDASPAMIGAGIEGLGDEILRQQEQVLAWINEGRFGSHRGEIFGRWYHALYDAGKYQPIFAALPGITEKERKWAMRDLSQRGAGNPEILKSIREALGTWYREGQGREGVILGYTYNVVKNAGGDPAVIFATETDPAIRGKLASDWMQLRLGYPATADRLGEVLELPEDVRPKALAQVMGGFDDLGIAGVKPALEEMNRHAMWGELACPATLTAVRLSAAKEWQTGGSETLASVMEITDPATRVLLMQTAGAASVPDSAGPEVYGRVLEAVPAGPERDACLAGMIRYLGKKQNLDLARQGLARIGDTELQASLAKEIPGL